MGISKNAVVGKAHRLELPARPSPIRRDLTAEAAPRPAATRRATGPTLPPLESPVAETKAPPRAEAPARPAVRVAPAPVRRSMSCCWPIGEPGTKEFHFCSAEAMNGKPYCAEHAQLAYVKVRDRRDEIAA
jgi:GcrA cell cycle regulator